MERSYEIPKVATLVVSKHIKLYLKDCKVVMTLAGKMCLVSLTFGTGYYGTIIKGVFYPNKQCTQEMVDQLLDVEARGIEAVKDIGKLTGTCCICGRTLTDEESIAAGIGPICAGRFPRESTSLEEI